MCGKTKDVSHLLYVAALAFLALVIHFEWVRPKGSCTDTDPLRPLMSSSVSPPPQTSPYPLVQYTSRHNKGCLKPSAEEREWNFQTHRERERRSAGERNGDITYFVFALNRKTRNVWR